MIGKTFTIMKTNLTLKKNPFILTFGLMLLLNGAFAQTIFEITAPAGIVGEYEFQQGTFGANIPGCTDMTPFTGELKIVDDGDDEGGAGSITDACQDVTNDLTGNIALIDRGSCSFDEKCLNAQNAGAIMAIVCNNVPNGGLVNMGVATQIIADSVTIPCIFLTYEDCQTIRVEIPGATVNMYWSPTDPDLNDVVIWDGGQFDGGLGDWTTNAITPDTAFWTWTEDGKSSLNRQILSPTVCNGAAIFDASYYNRDAVGNGTDHVGELISPIIDCTNFEYTSLKFYTYNLRLNGTTTFAVSIDGGMTWGNETTITTENVLTNMENNVIGTEIKKYFISEFPGEANCRIRFTFDDHRYHFTLDDVQLIEPERNNLALVNEFYSIAPNAVTPASQLEPFSFIADVANIGAETQTGVELKVSIDDSSGEVFSAILEYDDLAGGETAFDMPFPDYFTPDGSINDYSGTYHVTSDSVDFDTTDNFQFFNFSTSDTVFAKETGMTRTILPAASNWEGEGEPHSWAYGNYYHIVDGDNWWASSATFGLGNAGDPGIAGRLITLYLYKWDKDAPGGVSDSDMDPEEREPVAFYVYEILGTEQTTDLITVPLINFPSNEPGPIDLESDQAYVLMIEYSTNDEVDFALVASDVLEYRGMIFRTEETMDIADPGSRYASMLGVNGDLSSEPYSSLGFGRDLVPVVRLNISDGTIGFNDPLAPENIVEVSPNPANNKINLKVDLVETNKNVNIRILDVNGRLILDQNYEDIKTESLQIDVNNFANGAYFLHFITEKGMRTERFIVQHR